MAKKRRKWTVGGALTAGLGCICAVMLCALFYGVMVYQLAGEDAAPRAASEARMEGETGVLSLTAGAFQGESVTQEKVGGALCTVTARAYLLEGGGAARAITATPAAYLERLSLPGVDMQLVTGFVIDDLDALYAVSGDVGILAAREGDTVYLIEGPARQEAIYELGALARRDPI